MAKRTKKVVVSGVTSEQAEQAFACFAKADAMVQKITAEMDLKVTKIREKYADELLGLEREKETSFELVQTYATENRDSLFSKKKSYESAHGTFGFRTGMPKLKTKKGFTWAAVTSMLKELMPDYVRVAEEPAKDKMLADKDKEKVSELMEKCGVLVVQDESFYIECKKENEQAT